MIPQDYTVIDLEMTGLHPKNDAILEVGAAKIRNGEVTDTMDIFVNPGRKITQEITELTGITDEMVKEGLSPAAAFHKTAEFIGDDILVGHNIIFDYSFLKQQAVNEKVPFEKKAVDTLKAARKCMLRPEKSLWNVSAITLISSGSRSTGQSMMRWQPMNFISIYKRHMEKQIRKYLNRKI